MKPQISIILFLLIIASMIVFLSTQQEYPHITLSAPKVHSYYYSDRTESIPIHLLTTQPEHYYYNADYISSCRINDDDSTISFDVNDIRSQMIDYNYNNHQFQQVTLYLKPSISMSNSVLQMEHAQLEIMYDNGEIIRFDIGEFNYVFHTTFDQDISLGHLSATYHSEWGYPTVSGMNISLTNNQSSVLTIQSIAIVSRSLIANTRHMIKRSPCDKHTAVQDCLGMTAYNSLTSPHILELSETLREHQRIELYIPLSFIEIRHAERFVIQITYELHGQEKIYYIDDFPFVQTNPYQTGYEEEYQVYEFDSNN